MTEENHKPQAQGPGNHETAAMPEGVGTPESAAASGEDHHESAAAPPSSSTTEGEPIAPSAPPAPVAPQPSATSREPGQRRITRHTTTSTTHTETTTDETVVETVAIAPPVYAAPSGEHPRPVG
ncbi:hypothetical protein [Blastococcus sp. CCUG 61487]|uniref:hypothetical protein n=1 Tax=Blastococcus sp. CCUG 61487 TaxID=1840703 RepID=UPI0010C0820B|nr:hypothetical protein [Blastococcus sp. CCUG 61487]TKJ28473.1 hypothetical protein A6V29_00040 [Blastococcus sp. CCUG 61487]